MKYWSDEEIQILRDNYIEKTSGELSVILNRSVDSIDQKLSILKLHRSEEVLKKRNRSTATQFKKGHIPWTKGKKGIHCSPDTEFKKGHQPVQTKWDGYLSIRYHNGSGKPYFFIRIATSNWVIYHQYLWEMKNGKVPPGCFLRFKDRDTLNCDLENLILVNRKQHLDMNRNTEKAGEVLREAWRKGAYIKSDKWVAFTLAPRDQELRALVIHEQDLIELKRHELQLKREIRKHEKNNESV